MANPPEFEVYGTSNTAPFSLKIFRGEGMVLLGMDWKGGRPPQNFVGFGIEFKLPGGSDFFPIPNRLSFPDKAGNISHTPQSSLLAPIQKFRWIHFPDHEQIRGDYTYRVSPVFMDQDRNLSYGDKQEATVQLLAETYPGILNIGFTRGFISSQAFVDKFSSNGDISTLIPQKADDGLNFTTSNPKEEEAKKWMGFEARILVLNLLDQAIADPSAQVRVTAYDFNEPEVLSRLIQLGNRLKIIIDNSKPHGDPASAESQAEAQLIQSAGAGQVQRQHMGGLQHNKTLAVGGNINTVIAGSTNFSWRGFFVQNNNTMVFHGSEPIKIFFDAFENLWNFPKGSTKFSNTPSSNWNNLQLPEVKAKIAFSPHNSTNALLQSIADDIDQSSSSLMYSLAFLYQTQGPIRDSIGRVAGNNNVFVYGISDKTVGGLDIQKPDGNPPVVYPAGLLKNIPEPFKSEVTGGFGVRMHHKFLVIDFDKPNARVYLGSYNFSGAADLKNGENLIFLEDRRVAVSYMIQAVAMFDHYEFRDLTAKSTSAPLKLSLHLPPSAPGENPWWMRSYADPHKIRDRIIFSKVI